jgi:putative NIF3 family GTP cyclohydrolase 1 type 2
MRSAHPYEEPAFDLQQLAAPPEGRGLGRIGTFEQPAERAVLVERVKRELGLSHVLVAGAIEGTARSAAVCAGACGDLLNDAIAQQADVYLTGEIRHHDALKAVRAGITVICTLHSNSERAVLKRLKRRLEDSLPQGLPVVLSRQDRDPFAFH